MRKARSSSSTRTSFEPARIRTIFPSPTRPAKASKTRSPNFSLTNSTSRSPTRSIPTSPGFIRNTLNAHRCDVVLGIAQGVDLVQPTNPYYRTSYVAAYRKDGPLKGLDSLSDPRLKTAKIGIVAGTPPATFLAEKGCSARSNPTRWSSIRDSIRRPTK